MSFKFNPFTCKLDHSGSGNSSFPTEITTPLTFDTPSGITIQGKADVDGQQASMDMLSVVGMSSGQKVSFNGGGGAIAGASGGGVSFNGGNAYPEGDGNGGDVELSGGEASGAGTVGKVKVASGGWYQANLDTASLSANRNISFPNASGTIALQNGTNLTLTTPDASNQIPLTITQQDLTNDLPAIIVTSSANSGTRYVNETTAANGYGQLIDGGDLYVRCGAITPFVPYGGGVVVEPYNGTTSGDQRPYARIMFNPEKATLSGSDQADVIMSAHKYHPDGSLHQHFSIYTTNAAGAPLKRVDLTYLTDVATWQFSNTNLILQGALSSSSANLRGFKANPTFTGSGAGAAGLSAEPTHAPSASVSSAYGFINITKGSPGTAVAITNLYAGFTRLDTGNTEGTVTSAYGQMIENPSLGSLKPGTIYGVRINNQGEAGVGTAIALDIVAQTGSTTNIGLRIAKGDTYALQLSDTGTTAAGGITFGVDVTLYRSAADTLKTDDTFDAAAYKVAGTAGADGSFTTADGKTVTVSKGLITSIV